MILIIQSMEYGFFQSMPPPSLFILSIFNQKCYMKVKINVKEKIFAKNVKKEFASTPGNRVPYFD